MERREKILYALTGLLAGLLSGFLGTGGGMVAAPMFMGPLKLPPERALATSIFLLLPLCALSALFYGNQGLDITAVLPFLAGGAGGGLLCGLFYHKISPRLLQKVFALLMLYGGVRSLLG